MTQKGNVSAALLKEWAKFTALLIMQYFSENGGSTDMLMYLSNRGIYFNC